MPQSCVSPVLCPPVMMCIQPCQRPVFGDPPTAMPTGAPTQAPPPPGQTTVVVVWQPLSVWKGLKWCCYSSIDKYSKIYDSVVDYNCMWQFPSKTFHIINVVCPCFFPANLSYNLSCILVWYVRSTNFTVNSVFLHDWITSILFLLSYNHQLSLYRFQGKLRFF